MDTIRKREIEKNLRDKETERLRALVKLQMQMMNLFPGIKVSYNGNKAPR